MEPITTALLAALGKLAEPAVKDGYEALKKLIAKKLGAQHAVLDAVDSLEQKPESSGRRQTLTEELGSSSLTTDTEVITAARRLLESVAKLPGGETHVQQTVSGNRNIFSGTGDIHIGGNPL
jgi:hypothetical protein